ncbi:MAG: hypothetical protein HRT77_17725, partial [Halioglobus sp.]|nr:hypothetical protein [Halioglobus sp.]
MSEADQARKHAVLQQVVSPGLQPGKERLLLALTVLLTLGLLLALQQTDPLSVQTGKPSIGDPIAITAVPGVASLPHETSDKTRPRLNGEPAEIINWLELTVAGGDTLAQIFKRAGYGEQHLHDLISQSEDGKSLERIFPGQTFAFRADGQGQLLGV